LRPLAVVVVAGVVVAVVQAVQQRQWAVAAVLCAVAVLKRHPSAAWRIAVLGGATDRV
jgi:hypothetical protein